MSRVQRWTYQASFAAIATILGLATFATPAHAAWDSVPASFPGFTWISPGTTSGPPPNTGASCFYSDSASGSGSEAVACWQRSGDAVWVKDQRADGRSAIARISVIVGDSKGTKFVCRNQRGSGTWVKCSKNLAEPGVLYFAPCTYDAGAGRMSWDCTAAQSKTLAI